MSNSDVIVVKAGEVLKINADVAGLPLPIISWAKDGVEIEERARNRNCVNGLVNYVANSERLCPTRLWAVCANSEECCRNWSMAVNCKVLDKPGPPAGPLEITGPHC